jgi:hypothetical protein
MKNLLSVLLAALFLFTCLSASARLGDKEAVAKKKEKRLEKKYGVSDPWYKTDAQGKIIQECWQAPSEGWGVNQALKFARELIPPNMRKGKAKRKKVKGNLIFFKFPKGTTIVLSEGPNGIIQIEVHTAGFKGRRC